MLGQRNIRSVGEAPSLGAFDLEEEGLEGWVQEKIIKANDYLNTIREYLEGKQLQGVSEGIENNPVANALINYITKHRPDLLKYGADRVGDAIDGIASRLGNSGHISPDNIGKLIRQVEHYVTSNNNDMYEGVTENNQRGDSLVTDALKIMRGSELSDAVQALKTVLGNREYNDRRGHCQSTRASRKTPCVYVTDQTGFLKY